MGKAGPGKTTQNPLNVAIRTFRRTIRNSKDSHRGFFQTSSGRLCPVPQPVHLLETLKSPVGLLLQDVSPHSLLMEAVFNKLVNSDL